MADYRACILGSDGHFVGYETFFRADDAEAIEKARCLVADHGLEFWRGERLVTRLSAVGKRGAGAVTYEVKSGRMVPK
jgi:hypothetical protein